MTVCLLLKNIFAVILVATLNPQSRCLQNQILVTDVLTGKDKATIYVKRNPELQGYYTQNHQVTLMAQKVNHEKEHLIMHHELCHYPQLSVISYNFHISIV